MANIAEHYSRARHTSNLKVQPRTRMSASDVLGAAGMAAQEHEAAMMLWSVCYGGKSGQKLELVALLADKLAGYMARNRLKGYPLHIAMSVLAYYLYAHCHACDGVGYQIIPNSIIRSDDPCPECNGKGKPHPPTHPAFNWLLSYVEKLISIAGDKTMQKIAINMDI